MPFQPTQKRPVKKRKKKLKRLDHVNASGIERRAEELDMKQCRTSGGRRIPAGGRSGKKITSIAELMIESRIGPSRLIKSHQNRKFGGSALVPCLSISWSKIRIEFRRSFLNILLISFIND